ncbi:MAG TPA: nucleoside triphosphate pyrophosphohydrolase [Verrucomicrobiae bacterium]|nr:nucleoside triphosphate pyrophosphohydrolase [Verrucomicrobiae bacterium]
MPKQRSKARKTRRKPRPSLAKDRARIALTARDRKAGEWFAKMVALQARLRGPKGCPWDREQTHESLRRFLIEEAYEVLDAMESGDTREFASELGDLLLQVIFHAILAEETGQFTISDVIEAVHTKMIRRHPHVFGDVAAKTSAAVLKNWEQIKREEREGKAADDSALAGVPRSLPAVLEAYQLTKKAARVGFDWENLAGIFEKLDEEERELNLLLPGGAAATTGKPAHSGAESARRLEEETGDLLFACVNVARFVGVDPEVALKKANAKFARRFRAMEAAAAGKGARFADLPRDEKEMLWNQMKVRG